MTFSASSWSLTQLPAFVTSSVSNPIWVVKTRMLTVPRNAPDAYKTMFQGAKQIYMQSGVLGFYAGLLPSLFSVAHGALQFPIWEYLKLQRRAAISGLDISDEEVTKVKLGNLDILYASVVSKTIAGVATFPYQTVRTRLQIRDKNHDYKNTADCVRQMYKEGIRSFYRGYAFVM
jgi:hypothetical protein